MFTALLTRALLFGRVPTALAHRHRQLLHRRIRSMCWVMALLVVAWMIIEWPVLSGWSRWSMVSVRLLLAVSLVLLAGYSRRWSPTTALACMVLLQALGFAVLRIQLSHGTPDWLGVGYALFPFVLAAQLAVLPLPIVRSLMLSLPSLTLLIMPVWTQDVMLRSIWIDLWLFGLIVSLAVWAAAAQLSLFLDLFSARWDAAHDAMTGLSNRRSTQQRLASEWSLSQRKGTPLSLISLDIDHFKQVNDRWGHDMGDAVICAISELLMAEVRGSDLASRWGGEEFLLILPATPLVEALRVAERLRQQTEQLRVDSGRGPICCTISCGVAEHQRNESIEEWLKRADAALYAAKQNGRNRVEHADGSAAQPDAALRPVSAADRTRTAVGQLPSS